MRSSRPLPASRLNDVEGIVSSSGKRFLDPLRGQKTPDKGVKVEIEENRVRLVIDVKALYGNVIYDVAHRLQQRVKDAVEQMTGLRVEAVDVNISDIVMDPPKEKKPKPAETVEADEDRA